MKVIDLSISDQQFKIYEEELSNVYLMSSEEEMNSLTYEETRTIKKANKYILHHSNELMNLKI